MNKKNLKLLMELIFIFILPFIFICFTSTIGKTYQYDNEGNFETSEIELSFDNSIIKYNKTALKEVDFNNYIYYSQNRNIALIINVEEMPNNMYINVSNFNIFEYWYQGTYYYLTANNGTLILDNNEDDIIIYDNNEKQYFNNITLNLSVNNLTINNNIDIKENVQINTIWGTIKELIINTIELNDNILLDIIICYTAMWLIMWLLWHLLYGFFELLWHIIPRRE